MEIHLDIVLFSDEFAYQVKKGKEKKKRLSISLFLWISNRERKRTNADLEDKIRERRLPSSFSYLVL